MFKKSMITAMSIAILLTQEQAQASEPHFKQDLTVIGTIAVATAAAGPIGFAIGAISGGWLGQQVAAADDRDRIAAELADTELRLSTSQRHLATTKHQLQALHEEQDKFARMALDQLQLEMLFTTGASELTQGGEQRLGLLATFLKRNAELHVRIEGYADPRGGEQANLVLSKARAERVATALSATGIARDRMSIVAHGESESIATPGDQDHYALERRVKIELLRTGDEQRVAGIELR